MFLSGKDQISSILAAVVPTIELFTQKLRFSAQGRMVCVFSDSVCTEPVDVAPQFRYNGVRIEQLDDRRAGWPGSGRKESGVLKIWHYHAVLSVFPT